MGKISRLRSHRAIIINNLHLNFKKEEDLISMVDIGLDVIYKTYIMLLNLDKFHSTIQNNKLLYDIVPHNELKLIKFKNLDKVERVFKLLESRYSLELYNFYRKAKIFSDREPTTNYIFNTRIFIKENITWVQKEQTGFVYFAKSLNKIKIGASKDPYKRIKSINRDYKEEFEIFKVIQTSAMYELEAFYHDTFYFYRLKNHRSTEMFESCYFILELINKIK